MRGRRRSAAGPASPADVARQTTVAVSAVVALVSAAIGSGAVVGTPIAEAAGGVLAADATLVAPAAPALGIWSVIYAGLTAAAVHQLLPTQRSDPRQRRVGWLLAASLLLNAGWVLAVQAGAIGGSVAVVVALLAVLVVAFGRLVATAPTSLLQRVLLDVTVGLYLGWVAVATVAAVAAALVDAGWDAAGGVATAWAVAVLLAAGVVGVGLAYAGRGRLAPPLALAWGLVWVAVARNGGEPASAPAAAAASVAAVVTVLAAVAFAWRRRRG